MSILKEDIKKGDKCKHCFEFLLFWRNKKVGDYKKKRHKEHNFLLLLRGIQSSKVYLF